MRILGNDLLDMPVEFLNETGLEMTSKEDLFGQADFVSLNCDLNPTSFHLMNETTLAMMKTSAVLINTARGPIIDEPALIKALKNKQIAGAALDVFEVEPLPEGSPLLKMRNVLLSPHNANSSPEAWESVHESTIKNLMEELRKK
jgi:D-3-phosphoglycerate dehydrogenase